MVFYLHNALKKFFPDAPFDQLMALKGDCFRQKEGRFTQKIALGNKNYFIKQHKGIGWIEIFKNLFQLRLPIMSAENEWRAIEKCRALHLATATVVAFGKRGMNPATLQSFVLMEELPPSSSLETLVENFKNHPPTFIFKQNLIKKVAHIARTLHENGINHRDFYLCHFLLDLHASPEKLYLIDLHRAQIRKKTPLRWIIKDLAGLYFSSKEAKLTQRDLFRFMKNYHQKSLRDILSHERILKKIVLRGENLYRDSNKK